MLVRSLPLAVAILVAGSGCSRSQREEARQEAAPVVASVGDAGVDAPWRVYPSPRMGRVVDDTMLGVRASEAPAASDFEASPSPRSGECPSALFQLGKFSPRSGAVHGLRVDAAGHVWRVWGSDPGHPTCVDVGHIEERRLSRMVALVPQVLAAEIVPTGPTCKDCGNGGADVRDRDGGVAALVTGGDMGSRRTGPDARTLLGWLVSVDRDAPEIEAR